MTGRIRKVRRTNTPGKFRTSLSAIKSSHYRRFLRNFDTLAADLDGGPDLDLDGLDAHLSHDSADLDRHLAADFSDLDARISADLDALAGALDGLTDDRLDRYLADFGDEFSATV